MKLRSGKMKPYFYKKGILPDKLEEQIDTTLERFKEVTASHPQHAKELLEIISQAAYFTSTTDIKYKIREVYNSETKPDVTSMDSISGFLARLANGTDSFYQKNNIEPKYNGIIQTKCENFTIEILGNTEIENG